MHPKSIKKAHLCLHLLEGKAVSIANGFKWFGITNVPREIGRAIERTKEEDPRANGFGVRVSRIDKTGPDRFGQPNYWTEYRLNKAEHNREGMIRMWRYVKEVLKDGSDQQGFVKKSIQQMDLFFKNYK